MSMPMRRLGWLVLCLVLCLGACNGDLGPPFTSSLSHGSLFGHQELVLSGDLSSLGSVDAVRIGGILAYALTPMSDGLHVHTQGALAPGAVAIEIDGSAAVAVRRTLFRYDAPQNVPTRWAAFGASLTQGTQGSGIDPHSQLHGVSAVVARQAGVWLALPLFAEGLLAPLAPTDFNLDCSRKPGTGVNITHLANALTDPVTNDIDLRRGRIDPSLLPRDIAVGGSKLSDFLYGGAGQVAVIENLVELPDSKQDGFLDTPAVSQLERLETLDPEVAFSTDLLANDLDGAVVQPDDLGLTLVTPVDKVRDELGQIAARLGKLHGQYFIATMFRLTFLPQVALIGQRRIAAGTDTALSWAAKVQALDDAVDADNAALRDAVAPYPNLHLVDVGPIVDTLRTTGIDVDGQHLTPVRFGGLLSLDDLHFSDTGYALYANVFIDALNAALGATIPRADVAAVQRSDPYSLPALRAAGFSCVP